MQHMDDMIFSAGNKETSAEILVRGHDLSLIKDIAKDLSRDLVERERRASCLFVLQDTSLKRNLE